MRLNDRHPSMIPPLALAGLVMGLQGCVPQSGDLDTSASGQRPTSTTATTLMAGAAQTALDIPIGVPQGGFTGRMFPLSLPVDKRDTPYTTQFIPSTGVATRIPAKAVWLQQGDQVMVVTKMDLIYAFDGLLFALEDRISELTGVDVHDRVTFSTNHSHGSYGDHSQDAAMYLGGDQFNREIFDRMVEELSQTALTAYQNRAPAAIGVGFDNNFDPRTENQIFRDRREDNDDLIGVDGQVLGSGYKDPRLTLIRIDATGGNTNPADDTPVAVIYHFGMHGTVMGDDNPFLSTDAPGIVELKFQEQFDSPVVVMHWQGGAGDQSPAGSQDEWARLETIGEIAAPRIKALWSETPTKSGETVTIDIDTKSIHQDHDRMAITRLGTTDIRYTPYQKGLKADNVIYNADGSIRSPIDEFNTDGGAGLCGGEVPVPGRLWGLESTVFPYLSCALSSEIMALMDLPITHFELDWVTFPLQSAKQTVVSVARLGSVPIHTKGVGDVQSDFVMGFFPGEAVSLYSDTFRKRLEQATGDQNSICVAYSQDHEGYLLTIEDWLKGGYEPSINQWGPIQGEYILEQAVALAQYMQGGPLPDSVVADWPWENDMFELDPVQPDITEDAGTVPDRLPDYLMTRTGEMPTQAQPAAQIPRVTGIASFVWLGGDPAVDMPDVTLEHQAANGSWAPVSKRSGLLVDDKGYEMFVAYTPDPLSSRTEKDHYYQVEWQAVTDQPNLNHMAALPLGNYRLRVNGHARVTDGGSYPWPVADYTVTSNVFEVVPAPILVSTSGDRSSLTVAASYAAASNGWRLLSMTSNWNTPTALVGGSSTPTGTLQVENTSGQVVFTSTLTFTAGGDVSVATVNLNSIPAGTYTLRVTDGFGNTGATQTAL